MPRQASRPASPANGTIYSNTELGYPEVYINAVWIPIGAAPTAPSGIVATNTGSGRAFNDAAVSVSFSLPALSPNATSFTVTASTGQTATGASSPLTVTGIASSATPTFTVTATNAAGTSASGQGAAGGNDDDIVDAEIVDEK